MDYHELLERKKSLFTEILALSERQLLLLRSEGKSEDEIIENFVSLIDERQRLMDTIDSISDSAENRQYWGGSEKDNALKHEIQAIIASVQKNDNDIKDAGQKILTHMGAQINLAKTTKQAYAAYHYEDSPQSMGWFIDRKK